jgi:hypothetical protein
MDLVSLREDMSWTPSVGPIGLKVPADAGTALEEPGRRPKDWPALAEPQRQLFLRGIDRGDGMSRGRS